MAWRIAKSLETLRTEINVAYPKRSKSSDGTIGDADHASRDSDHNPWVKDGKVGVVTALDVTNDPANGVNSEALAKALLASRDSRIKYIISNRKIVSSTKNGKIPAWTWRPYNGANPHDKHMHLSVKSSKTNYDSTVPWDFVEHVKPNVVKSNGVAQPAPVTPSKPPPPENVVQGDANIWNVQRRLKALNYHPGGTDGVWGGLTAGAISGFVNDRELNIVPPTSAEMFLNTLEPLRAELAEAEAEHYTRPIAPERKAATPAEVSQKLPDVQSSIKAERLGFWGSIAAATSAAITGISKFFGDAVGWLSPIKEFVGDMPWPVWVCGALAISGALYYISRKSGEAKTLATQAYQDGLRS